MLYYMKKYPISLLIIAIVIYLSFFTPPSDIFLSKIPHFDKIVHFGIYFVMSGALWFEFLRNNRNNRKPMYHAWIGGFLAPVLFGGVVEILQEQYTVYRGGDWFDMIANTTGALLASLLARYIIAPKYYNEIEGRQNNASSTERY